MIGRAQAGVLLAGTVLAGTAGLSLLEQQPAAPSAPVPVTITIQQSSGNLICVAAATEWGAPGSGSSTLIALAATCTPDRIFAAGFEVVP